MRIWYHSSLNMFRRYSLLITLGLCSLFVLFCLVYSQKIYLWGDEAFSLNRSSQNWLDILRSSDGHLATYYLLFLKPLTRLLGSHQEILLRFIHVLPFGVGLFFGYLIILKLDHSKAKANLILALTIMLPQFIFYATNIRMYSLLFLASMMFIYSVLTILQSQTKKIFYILSSIFLISIDYAGILLYSVSVLFLGFYFYKNRQMKSLVWGLSPLGVLLFFLPCISADLITIITWPVAKSQGIQSDNFNLSSLLKSIFFFFRPAFDLIYPASLPKLLALSLPAIITVFIFSAAFFYLKKNFTVDKVFIVVMAFYWLLISPFGFGFSRIFLSCLFFMIAILVLSLADIPKPLNLAFYAIIGLLLTLNLQQAFNPTLRLYNLIPYPKIAQDTLNIAQQFKIQQVLLSDNSLNRFSIERFLDRSVQVKPLKPDADLKQIPSESFLFISHLDENELFVDKKIFSEKLGRQVQNVGNYVKLDELPYNTLWKQRLLARSSQPYAISIYLVKKKTISKVKN